MSEKNDGIYLECAYIGYNGYFNGLSRNFIIDFISSNCIFDTEETLTHHKQVAFKLFKSS